MLPTSTVSWSKLFHLFQTLDQPTVLWLTRGSQLIFLCSVADTHLISPHFISTATHFNWTQCAVTESFHSAWPSLPWLWPITVHSVQMKWRQTSDISTPLCVVCPSLSHLYIRSRTSYLAFSGRIFIHYQHGCHWLFSYFATSMQYKMIWAANNKGSGYNN